MSRIWESLREAEKERARLWERRSTARLRLHVPLLVYGYTVKGETFHELTKTCYVNAGGGLIALSTGVTRGQKLLLFNERNGKEQECFVTGRRSTRLNGFGIAVAFLQVRSDFWREVN